MQNGTYTLTIKTGLVKVFSGEASICGDSTLHFPAGLGTLTVHGCHCPQAEGELKLTMEMDMPASIPAFGETAQIHLDAVDQDGGKLMCVDVQAKIVKDAR